MEKFQMNRLDKGESIMKKIEVEHCDMLHSHCEVVKDIQGHMPCPEELKELADFFKVFGDTTRIKILYVLFQSEMCVCDLAQTLDMTQSAISHQLRTLKQMKLVTNRREGKTVFYSLADSHIKTILNQGMEHISE